MKLLGVPGVFDYAGLNRSSRYRACSCCLTRITKDVGVRIASFRSWIPTPPILGLRFAVHLTIPSARLEAERIAIPFS